MCTPAAAPRRGKRADAVRNREAVVRAAAEVFTEEGPAACVETIAERAGVGKATIYRSFPTKEHLVAAVAAERLHWLAELSEAALDDADDAWIAVRDVLRAAVRTRGRSLIAHGLGSGCEHDELHAALARSRAGGEALLARGRREGVVRDDVTHDDLLVLFRGVTLSLVEAGVTDGATWERYADLVADAIRARPA